MTLGEKLRYLRLVEGNLRGLGRDELPWLVCTAYVSLSYVAGFLTLPAPGGLGVREAILQQLLARQFAASLG